MMTSTISEQLGNALILFFLVGIPVYGLYKKVPVYDTFVEGAKEGFALFLTIFPYMVGMLVAIGMLRASGFFDVLTHYLSPVLSKVGIPAEIVPIALIRPFSGSGALAALADLVHTHGGDAVISHVGAIVANASDTILFVIAIYFGAARIRHPRHAISLSIIVDIIGIVSAVWIAQWLLHV